MSAPLGEEALRSHLEAVSEQGFTILRDVATPERVAALEKRVREIERATLRPLEEGEEEEDSSFYRTAGLLRLDPLFWPIPIDPTVAQVFEGGNNVRFRTVGI